jgi:hypothetical protein
MFSIEKTLEEIIVFVRKFFFTIYYTFFKAPQLIVSSIPGEKLVRPSLYLLIWMFIHFGQLAVDFNIYNEKASHAIEDFGKFFEASTLENNLLYILPMGALIWLLTLIIGRIFFRDEKIRSHFHSCVYYWLGDFLALVALYGLIKFISYEAMKDWPESLEKKINASLSILLTICRYAVIPIILTAVVLNYKRVSRTIFWLMLIIMPSFIFGLSILTQHTSSIIANVLEIHKEPLSIMSSTGTDFIYFVGTKANPNDTAQDYRWDADILVQNDANKIVRIPRGSSLTLYSGDNEKPQDDSSDEIDLNVDSFNGDSSKGFYTLKPHDYVQLHCHQTRNMIQIRKWKSYSKPDNLNEAYPGEFQLTLNDPEGVPYVVGKVKVSIGN